MKNTTSAATNRNTLHRELGVFGATMMGLGSIVGTGVFVSVGIAAGAAGPAVVIAILLAAGLALCNALSSAQLAANHPVSGGTYEYGYRLLSPSFGFTAGWMFLCAKSASAATAALGFAGYLLHGLGADGARWLVPVAAVTTISITIIVLSGIRRASWVNILIVSLTLGALIVFVLAGIPSVMESGRDHFLPLFDRPHSGASGATAWEAARGLLYATALMFVAYTGYGRIATLGEEVRSPRTTIPRAILTTLIFSAMLYAIVSIVAIGTIGADRLSEATRLQAAPLETVAKQFRWPDVHWAVTVGAMTAMLGVLLNLILGLSRVLLAMGRRQDMPTIVARISGQRGTPVPAVIIVGAFITGLAMIGSVEATWSFSAFTVLVYYAVTNLAALQLPREDRLYSPVFAWGGLIGCVFLAFWVDRQIWLTGLALIAAGLAWRATLVLMHRRRSP